MAPHDGLVHLKEYDVKDSNVELIGSDIDHKVKYASAATEPAWNDGRVGRQAGLWVWRIEDFAVVAVPEDSRGRFYEGDSYVVLHSYKVGAKDGRETLGHDVFFWLGSRTSQDEAGVAAYKTVELDEFLHGTAAQHRELQASPSDQFVALFPRLTIRRGGVRSGFRHVEPGAAAAEDHVLTLLRVFKHPGGTVVVHEVDPTWHSLDDDDVFVLDTGAKIWVWQGAGCSPMEKAKAAQVVHDMTLAKHVDVEVLAEAEARSHLVVSLLGGNADGAAAAPPPHDGFRQPRPIVSRAAAAAAAGGKPSRLWRLSDASGRLSFDLAKDGSGGEPVSLSDFSTDDVFLLDSAGSEIWVWEGRGASRAERAMWLKVAQAYVQQTQANALTPIAKVQEGNESPAFLRAIEA